MIRYQRGGINYILKIFKTRGSVFPFALCIATPCALLCGVMKSLLSGHLFSEIAPWMQDPESIMRESQAWSGFSFLVGFLIVFRTSQAYSRFWDGCTATYLMRAEWFDACSALISFCKCSKAHPSSVQNFQQTLVRLFSMLHAVALADIEDSNTDNFEDVSAFKYELMDAEGIDATSLLIIKESDAKVELVYQWIQLLIVENIETGVLSIPPPILSRSFQEIANGMVQFHEALKISTIPFPFPYAQTCDCLLLLHWLIVPFVVCTWTTHPFWATVLCFVQVFILWVLNAIAVEIENPFGMDANDIDASSIQMEVNRHLALLIDPDSQRVPQLSPKATFFRKSKKSVDLIHSKSFSEIWNSLDVYSSEGSNEAARTIRRKDSRKISGIHCNDFQRDIEAPSQSGPVEVFAVHSSNFSDHVSASSLQRHLTEMRSVSKESACFQTSSIVEAVRQDHKTNNRLMVPRPAPSSKYFSEASTSATRDDKFTKDKCPTIIVHGGLPHAGQMCDDASVMPHIPESRSSSLMSCLAVSSHHPVANE